MCVCARYICVRDPSHASHLQAWSATGLLQFPTNYEFQAHGPWPDSPTKSASLPRWDPRATAGDCSCRVACPWWHRTPLLKWKSGDLLAQFFGCSLYAYFSKKTGHPKRSTLICGYMMKSCWIHEFAAVNHGIHHQFHRLNPRLIAINHY